MASDPYFQAARGALRQGTSTIQHSVKLTSSSRLEPDATGSGLGLKDASWPRSARLLARWSNLDDEATIAEQQRNGIEGNDPPASCEAAGRVVLVVVKEGNRK